MILGEPQRTQADLHFRAFGIPVRVHPFFWLVALFLGMGGGPADPVLTLIWVGAVFVSVLVHELGHAFAARAHGWPPSITLYGLGGLASYSPTYHTPRSSILISVAGPAAGFALAAAVLIAIRLAGHTVELARIASPFRLVPVPLVFFQVEFAPFAAVPLNVLIVDLLWINIMWGLINLLPVYPLDGGQIARELLVEADPSAGIRRSLWLSIATGAGLAAYALTRQPPAFFMAVLFGMLAYSSYTALRAYAGRGGHGRW